MCFGMKSVQTDPQKGPAERGHVQKEIKNRQKLSDILSTLVDLSKLFSTLFSILRAGQKQVENWQKVSWRFFDSFRAALVFWPLLGGSENLHLHLHFSICALSGAISHDNAILSLRYPISRDTFSGRLALPQNGAMPPLGSEFRTGTICAMPRFATYRAITARYPIKKTTRKSFAIPSLRKSSCP